MNYRDIDYRKYLSIDNGNGILLSKEDINILEKYGFNFYNYNNIKEILMDLDNLCNDDYQEELEELIQKLNEIYYYNYIKK